MRLSEAVKPISYLKAHAAQIIEHFQEDSTPLIITQNGEAKAVFQDIREYEETQQTFAMLQLIALGRAEVRKGRTKPLKQAFADVRKMMREKYK